MRGDAGIMRWSFALCLACCSFMITGCLSLSNSVAINDENVSHEMEQLIRGQSPAESFLTDEKKSADNLFTADDRLSQVIVEGNKTIPAYAILGLVRTRAETQVKGAEVEIRQDISKLYNTGWFYSVEARYRRSDSGIILVYVVDERPILQKVEYRGNDKGMIFFGSGIRERTLQNLTGLVEGHAFSVGINKEAVKRISEYYKEKGYRFAEVTLTKGGDPNDREVIIDIKEGPKVRVNKISFKGNTVLSDRVLALKIASKKSILSWFGGVYNPDLVADDITALKSFYHNIGYFDVTIKEKVLLSEDKSSIVLHYDVNEGVRYEIASVKFSGNQVYDTGYLAQDLQIKPGAMYKQLDVNKDLVKVTEKYNTTGRLFTKVEAKPIFTGEPGKVDLLYQIKEDKVRYIARINVNIRGDKPHTRETLVLNQLLFAPGDLANADLIRRSKNRLERSAIWQGQGGVPPNVNLKPIEGEMYARSVEQKTYRGQDPVLDQFSKSISDPESICPPAWKDILKQNDVLIQRRDDEPLPEVENEVPIIRTINEESPTQKNVNGEFHTHARTVQRELQPVALHVGHSIPVHDTSSKQKASQYNYAVNEKTIKQEQGSSTYKLNEFNPEQFSQTPVLSNNQAHQQDWELKLNPDVKTKREAPEKSLAEELLLLDPEMLFTEQADYFNLSGEDNNDHDEMLPCQLYDQTNGMIIRGQSYDSNGIPPNPVFNNTPGGDIFGQQLRNPEPPAFVDVDVDVSESQTGRFMFSVGVNSDSGVVASIVLEEQNFDITNFPRRFSDWGNGAFRGNGEQFRIEAVPGDQVSRYMVNWTNPYFMGTNYSLGLSGFFFNRFFESYEERRLGGRVQVGRMLSRYLSANVALRLEDVEVRNPSTTLVPDLNEVVGNNFLATVKPGVAWDTRDSSFMPSEGIYLEGSAEQAFSDFSFTKLEFIAKKYYTVYQRIDNAGRHVFALSGNMGWTTDNTPLFERYYAGGVQTFRGFQYRGVTPRVGTTPTGGFWQLLGSAEYILPITAGENFRLIAFSDFGTVDDNVSLDKFRVSVGGGMRITIPQMGPVPIALDWAVPLVREDRDQTRVFQFYIGFTR